MKKLFTLLTLLVTVATGTWASSVSDLTSITAATTITMDGLNGTAALEDKTLYADGKLICLGGCGYSTSKGSTTYNEVTYPNVYQIKSNRQIALKIGFKATITIVGQSNSSRTWRLGTSSAGNEIAESAVSTTTLTANVDGSSKAQLVYINASGDLYLGAIIITANESSDPTISATSPVSIKARTSGMEVTQDITVSGENLTGSTLTATLSPAVAGLSVTLGSSTITDGEISTTATLHYTQTENASGSTTLTLSDGTTSKEVTVNYISKVVKAELTAISSTEITSMDLSKVGTSGMEPLTVDDGYVVLSDAGATVSFADNLAVSCTAGVGVTWRSDAVQGPLFKFKTTVPGTVTVKFSDVGSSGTRANRYAAVNETLTDVYSTTSASTGVVTCSPIAVQAGEVIIKGKVDNGDDTYTDNQIRVFQIVFTPQTETITITDAKYATFVPSTKVAVPDGVKAYIVTAVDTWVTLSAEDAITVIPANEPVIIYKDVDDATEVTFTATSDAASDVTGNKLLVSNGSDDLNGKYVLANKSKGVGFYKWGGTTIPAGKVYLDVSAASAPEFLSFSFGEVTAIESIAKSQEPTANGQYFNLNGQRVATPSKGLYIINGKKVVIK